MASRYYYQNSPYYGYSYNQPPALSVHLCFFFLIVFLFMGLSWYINYESVFESLIDQLKIGLILSPLVLLLVAHLLTSAGDWWRMLPPTIPLPEKDSFGVAFVLVVLMFMISYRSYFHERWFPLLSR